MDRSKTKAYVELAARIYVFIVLNLYGFGKMAGQQFYRKGKLPTEVAQQTLGEVGSFDLAWTFMGHSYFYILFIGLSQIIGAWLLLWNRTKLVGIAILLPILLNIIVIDMLFFDDGKYGAMASALLYFSLLIIILILNREKVLEIIRITTKNTRSMSKESVSRKLVFASLLVILFFGIDQLLVNILGH